MIQAELFATTIGTPEGADSGGMVVSGEIHTFDSMNRALKDSIQNLHITDLKDVMTGDNPILRDSLHALTELTIGFIPKLIAAIIVLWLGFKLSKVLKKTIVRMLDRRTSESSIKGFLSSFVDMLMKILVVIVVMDIIGIKATSFIAILGAMGLAIGMALQGTLQNFAGGVIILLMKPFRVGDYVECGNYKGYVRDIRIFHTIVEPLNGRIIVVPNSELATTTLINHTKQPQIRMSKNCSVAYGSDLDKVEEVLQQVLDNDPLIIHEPRTTFYVSNLNESSVDYELWIWTKTTDYWTVWKRILRNIYTAFDENGIEIPFNQLDVHLDK